jgi:hypothetical protein
MMRIQMKTWVNGLFVSTVFLYGATAMELQPTADEKPSVPTVKVDILVPEHTPVTVPQVDVPKDNGLEPVNTTEATIVEIEERVQSCCFAFSTGAQAANNLMSQAMVTSLLLSQNVVAYDALLNNGLNKDNIMKFQDQLQKILGVTNLNKETITMIQQVIAAHPTPKTLTGKKQPIQGTQMQVTRSLLKDNRGALDKLMVEGMTAKNFKKSQFKSRVLAAANVEDTKEHRKLVQTVMKTYTIPGLLNPADGK